ncbi:MOG interacting and ectopic P-granules protein 1 isoform X1 [Halyomorpha halys]|uniref:MOG interacting and ectopic P-granules protein 1 isoform X1 n=1 Tax=Halyomorpha halys TaxID=286706 RepID=UPI0006D4E671|nr:MOG interacting and ectopic P-granules protein 1 isoform X2 [Halyomorpha halys]
MMETEPEENEPSESFYKQVQGEVPTEDPLKLNGDINGSRFPIPSPYDDSYREEDEEEEEEEASSEAHTNGEVTVELVPSQENGVDNMDVDSEIMHDDEPMDASDVNGDVKSPIVDSDSYNSVKKLSVSDVSDEDSVSAIERNENSESVDPLAISETEGAKDFESGDVQEDNTVYDEEVKITAEERTMSESTTSKDMEDLAKLSSHGSLEITLVKTPMKSTPIRKEEEPKDEISVHSGDKDDKEAEDLSYKTPEKGPDDEDSVIEISPEKTPSKKKKEKPPPTPPSVPPRRSSRNLNKTKSYADKDIFIEELDKKSDDEVEEVILTDPLADVGKKTPKKTTIVVNDTKKLVEIAAGSKQPRGAKKEPTLVIIDTNSILSGKGAVPVGQATLPQMSITPSGRSSSGFSMLPVPAAFVKQPSKSVVTATPVPQQAPPPPPAQPKPAVLPSLTDDMFVVEAPSFIVPYVYEKPPVTALKEYVKDLEKAIKEHEKEERRRRKEEKEKKEDKADDKVSTDKPDEKMSVEKEDEKGELSKAQSDVSVEGDSKPENETVLDADDQTKKNDAEPEIVPTDNDEKSIPKDEKECKSDTETDEEGKDSDSSSRKDSDGVEMLHETKKKSESYFDGPLGKFFMQIGVNLVQEHVQSDLLRNQKRKRDKEGENCPLEVHMAISSLTKTLEFSKENNEPYKLDLKKCKLCNFKTESALVMAHHLETPHMRNYVYRCNFCTMEVRSPHDILFHMEAEHNVRGRLERAPAFHQCPNCPFEDNQKGKLSRHLLSCAKKYKPERNQEPTLDWEPPAKIPRVRGPRAAGLGLGAYQPSIAPRGVAPPVGGRLPSPSAGHSLLPRGRGRPPIYVNRSVGGDARHHAKTLSAIRPGVVFRPSGSNAQPQVLLPSSYPMAANPLYQVDNASGLPLPLPIALVSNAGSYSQNPAAVAAAGATAKLLQQPSISITPLPRQQGATTATSALAKPGRPPGSVKTTFVICEICDGYIKDLEQLRNHMQWIHKVKIHPKMIYNRPPLNCQKCQFRFFTDQGLERHLLGSHGLVTSSMQEAANKGRDGGRCPVCGRVYQWKLLNHVARDHSMSLKPAHLSYKCTVCTATFGMYKQFENHVYSAHSVVAKRVMEKKSSSQQPSTSSSPSSTSQQSDSYQPLKPLKINDEITIIPQPARAKTKPQPAPAKTNKA